jgi:hypothetical protein
MSLISFIRDPAEILKIVASEDDADIEVHHGQYVPTAPIPHIGSAQDDSRRIEIHVAIHRYFHEFIDNPGKTRRNNIE